MMTHRIGLCTVTIVVLGLLPGFLRAGNIDGIARLLKPRPGTTTVAVEDATIEVFDVDAQKVVGRYKTGNGGAYNIPLPSGSAVNVTFTHRDNLPAALIGISGDVVLKEFTIFMPLRHPEGESCEPECECINNCDREYGRCRRILRCRR